MSIEQLKNIFEESKNSENGICVALTLPNINGLEYIINSFDNLDSKLEYYSNTYDKNGIHKNNPSIRIIKAFTVNIDESWGE